MGSSSSQFNYDEQLLSDLGSYSVEVKGADDSQDAKDGLAGVPRTAPQAADGKLVSFVNQDNPDPKEHVKTVYEALCRGTRLFPDQPCMGTRLYELEADDDSKYARHPGYQHPTRGLLKGLPKRTEYVWEDYKSAKADVDNFGFGLLELGCKAGDNLGILSVNRAEWVKASLGFYSQSMRTTSLYDTLGHDAVEYIMGHAELPLILIEKKSLKMIEKLLPTVAKQNGGHLHTVVQMNVNPLYKNVEDTLDPADVKTFEAAGVNLVGFSQVLEMGAKAAAEKGAAVNPPKPSDVAFVMYTSGTTGKPKGAILTHKNLMCGVAMIPIISPLDENDVHLSYLPLAHIFETLVEVACLTFGSAIGFSQGQTSKILDDFTGLRPTLLPGVPRVFTKVYQKVFAQVSKANCLKRFFFNKFYNSQCDLSRAGKPLDEATDKKVFAAIRKKIGLDRCKLIITGAAPCPPYLMEFLRVVIKCNVLQGYGMTETAATISISLPNDPNVGHVGPPMPNMLMKLVSVPEMNYTVNDKPYPRGEIVVKGDNVFEGYYKNDKATKETIIDGWLHTGDIGRLNPNGTFSIIDRKKNIFKMAQGEYIAAEKIEMAYSKSPLIGQVWVYGNSFKSFVLAVVVPAADPIVEYGTDKGWWDPATAPKIGTEQFSEQFKAMCDAHEDEIKDLIKASLAAPNKTLKGFEKVKDIVLEAEIDNLLMGFNVANECQTPTFKLRRPFLLRRYVTKLQALYEKHGEPNKASEHWPGLDKPTEKKQ